MHNESETEDGIAVVDGQEVVIDQEALVADDGGEVVDSPLLQVVVVLFLRKRPAGTAGKIPKTIRVSKRVSNRVFLIIFENPPKKCPSDAFFWDPSAVQFK